MAAGNQADRRHEILLEKARVEAEMDDLFTASKYLTEQHLQIDEARSQYTKMSEELSMREYPVLARLADENAKETAAFMAKQCDVIEEQILDNRTKIAATQERLDDIARQLMNLDSVV
ncbi:MAG: hypothetical protein IKZ87_02080 [Actinomycetaceae bacterium]|nr:hypothetical protein [Actinomycetaceae bacterium]